MIKSFNKKKKYNQKIDTRLINIIAKKRKIFIDEYLTKIFINKRYIQFFKRKIKYNNFANYY